MTPLCSSLEANPDDQILRNNLMFALASAVRIDEEREQARSENPRMFDGPNELNGLVSEVSLLLGSA